MLHSLAMQPLGPGCGQQLGVQSQPLGEDIHLLLLLLLLLVG